MTREASSFATDDVQPEKHSQIFWVLSDSWVMAKRSVKHITRNLDQLLSVALFPIMFFLLFSFVFGGAIDTGGISYVNFLVAGIMVQMLAFGSNYTTLNLAIDLQRGIVDRFRSLPMASSSLLAGHVGADLLRNTISALLVLAVSFPLGFQPVAGPVEWLLVFGLILVFSLAFSWLSAIMGLLVKSMEAAQWTGFIIIFPLTFVSSAFVPTDTMPEALRLFAENQPLTHVIEAMRAWLVGTPVGDSGWLAFAWCIGIIVVSVPIATWIFRRKTSR
ncbi:ABC transporter permease [Nitrososphaera viennensis]|uniref:ABC superfamily ATP binding cassette transporter membrane protein, Drug Exporter-1 (DrugE1) Family n=2 Tax=Nitrososphaera viennensis TaxID=1034015 RepID=A0A060HHB0_9ARCH|nr:ABC transporter permease [Nitrososphaera viennensis]AIC14923.1 ABC superfamily ATP binding cassette transporter membrane protein, Drug Exporter-1 (DrugE1) Family [Nitrososphaera viennensis EN76]UVS69865.1 ABC transporter permease [Nitrososphaera viennensis]